MAEKQNDSWNAWNENAISFRFVSIPCSWKIVRVITIVWGWKQENSKQRIWFFDFPSIEIHIDAKPPRCIASIKAQWNWTTRITVTWPNRDILVYYILSFPYIYFVSFLRRRDYNKTNRATLFVFQLWEAAQLRIFKHILHKVLYHVNWCAV